MINILLFLIISGATARINPSLRNALRIEESPNLEDIKMNYLPDYALVVSDSTPAPVAELVVEEEQPYIGQSFSTDPIYLAEKTEVEDVLEHEIKNIKTMFQRIAKILMIQM